MCLLTVLRVTLSVGLQAQPLKLLHRCVILSHQPYQVLDHCALDRWIVETNDLGRFPESDAALKAALKRWGAKAVNVEYDRVRER